MCSTTLPPIEKRNAIALYRKSDAKQKEILQGLWPDVKFNEEPMDWVKTWEDICEVEGIHPVNSLPYPNASNPMEKWLNGAFKASTATKVVNNGWVADFDNDCQVKWYIWWKLHSGFRFSYTDHGWARTYSYVGPRLSFESEKKAKFAGTVLADVYKDYYTQ